MLPFTLNADGAQVYNSKKNSIWPVQLYQDFLPPEIRFKPENVILCILYYGACKPEISKILHPLAEEIDRLQQNKIKFIRNGDTIKCVPIVMFCSVDLPAKAMLSGLKTYSGGKACTMFLHTGKPIKDHLGRKYTRYVKVDPNPEQRTHAGAIKAVKSFSIKSTTEHAYGFIRIPPMILFTQFDLAMGFTTDYMHNITLGVMKLLLDFWLGSHRLCNKSKHFKPMPQKKTR